MRTLLKFLIRIYPLLLFILLEVIAISLLVNRNHFHQAVYANAVREFTGKYNRRLADFTYYFSLKEENKRLAAENVRLKNRLAQVSASDELFFRSVNDKEYNQRYLYTEARVINNSTSLQHNFITLDKGREEGIEPEMAVASSFGIVGVVRGVSEHFATVMPVINRDFRISAKLKRSGYFGSLTWPGSHYQQAKLSEIPLHAQVSVGDTITTSGYSSIYPEGLVVGFVKGFQEFGGSFYSIDVQLAVDFKRLNNVQVIKSLMREEKIKLEEANTE